MAQKQEQNDLLSNGTPFYFKGDPVGNFTADLPPSAPGQYQYEPSRGPGHYKLMTALKSAGSQRCFYIIPGGKKMVFIVVTWVKYGLLELNGFASGES